jgi:hypothetical protein
MIKKTKLAVEDFYHQFPGHEHHNDPGTYNKPEWHQIKGRGKHKGLDLRALRNSKIKGTKLAQTIEQMRQELMKRAK